MDCFVAYAPRNDGLKKWPGFLPAIFMERLPYRGGAMPGGGGGSDAVPPLSSGVMPRTVTRRLMRVGPQGCSFGYFDPWPSPALFSPGPAHRLLSAPPA